MKTKLSSWALIAALALPGGALMACGEAREAGNEAGNQVEKAGQKIKKEAEKAGEKIKKEAEKAKDKATDSDGGNSDY